jgi:hypothetical protein
MMKVMRYKLRGNTHKKGITATPWQSWFVVATSKTDPQKAKTSHDRTSITRGTGEVEAGFDRSFSD